MDSTRIIGEAIGRCDRPPSVWLNASTATVYKHTFDEAWDESGEMDPVPAAKDAFSLEVAKAWEATLGNAPTPRTRKIALRMAMTLGLGANSVFPVLRRMTRLGLGGRMGDGKQFVSWLHIEDYRRAVEWLIERSEFSGPVNLVAPNPIPNAEMMRILRETLGVPIGLSATAWMLEIGAFFLRTETELIIKSRRVVPGKLVASGFEFRFPTIRAAFEDLERKLCG